MTNQWSGLSDKERFLQKVLGGATSRSVDGCWLWLAAVDKDGYGTFRLNGRKQRANRASYILFVGPIPDQKIVCHFCDNPQCVNPDHLWIGSHADNIRDRDDKNRTSKGERHYNAKLNALDVWLVRNLDLSYSKIASFFGISKGHVSNIKKNRKWSSC